MKRILFFLFRLFVSLGFLALVAMRVDWQECRYIIHSSRGGLLIAAFGLNIVTLIMTTARWYLLLRAKSEDLVSFRGVLDLSLVGLFFNTFVPGGIAGDLVRGHRARRYRLSGSEAFGSVVVDRFLGLMSFVVISLVGALLCWSTAIAFEWQQRLIYLYVATIGGFFVIVSLPIRRWVQRQSLYAKPLVSKVFDLYSAIASYPRYRAFWGALGFSLMAAAMMVGTIIVISMALNIDVRLSYLAWVVPIVGILSTVPVSLSGWGVREAGYIFFLEQVGVPTAQATILSVTFGGIVLLLGSLGGMWCLYTTFFPQVDKMSVHSDFGLPGAPNK